MNPDDPRQDRDHPQTTHNEPLGEARRPAMFRDQGSSGGGDAGDAAGSGAAGGEAPAEGPAEAVLSDGDAEAVRAHAQGGRSIGESIHGGAGMDQGSGTPGDKGDLGGGDPQKVG